MEKYSIALFLIIAFFTFFISPSFLYAVTCQDQCASEEECYDVGFVWEGQYCNFDTLAFSSQKALNQSCSNDYECLSGRCFDSVCSNEEDIYNQTGEMSAFIEEYSYLTGKTNCSALPGCFDLEELDNAHILSNALCLEEGDDFNCFECDTDYDWDDVLEECFLVDCYTEPGCIDVEELGDISNYLNRTLFCDDGYQCINCKYGYDWDNSSLDCVLDEDSECETDWDCSEWGSCSQSGGGQTRTCVLEHPGCTPATARPQLRRSCSDSGGGDGSDNGDSGQDLGNEPRDYSRLIIIGVVVVLIFIVVIAIIVFLYFWKFGGSSDKDSGNKGGEVWQNNPKSPPKPFPQGGYPPRNF